MPAKPIGLHVHSRRADADLRRYIETVRPKVVKWLSEGVNPELVRLAKSRGALTVLRVFEENQQLGNPHETNYLARVDAELRRFPDFDAVEGYNEAFQRLPDIRRRAEADIRLMQVAQSQGKKAVIGSFSVGQPQWPATGHPDDWGAYLPALEMAGRMGHFVGLHEYGAPAMQWGCGANQASALENGRWVAFDDGERPNVQGWFVLRYRRVIEHWRALGLDPLPKIVITESGLDDIQPRPDVGRRRGYKTYRDTEWWDHPFFGDYAAQLAWTCRRWAEDPLVVGGVDFGFADASGDWSDFDLSTDSATFQRVIAEMQGLPDTPAPPDDDEEEPPDEGDGIEGRRYRAHIVQQGDTLWRLAGARWHEIQRVVPMEDPRELAVGSTVMIPEDIDPGG